MKSLTIEGQPRTDLGKKYARQLRREDRVPCVLYGKGDNIHFSVPSAAFKELIYTPEFHTVDVVVGGEHHTALVKEVQFDPVSDKITHADFLTLVPGKVITADLPVKVFGNSVGVRNGGKLKLKVRKLTVKTTPEHLVETIDIDVTELKMGKSVRVSEISREGIEIQNNPGLPVVTCEVPRAMRGGGGGGDDAEGEEGAEGAEGEGEGGDAAAES
jgi:large subunit ribosomal protein L25